MAKTINFCGDSFCDGIFRNLNRTSWCLELAALLNAEIIGKGGLSSSSYEYAIQSFNPKADYNIFCWTDSHRLYSKNFVCQYKSGVQHLRHRTSNELLSLCAELFYREFYTEKYFDELQMRSLYWFDHEVLSQYKGKILHFWNFSKTYTFTHGVEYPDVLKQFIVNDPDIVANHMTPEQNMIVAENAFNLIRRTYG